LSIKEKKMTIQNYLIIENNVVTNDVVWDGNTETWQPPTDSIQLVEATTPAMVWELTTDEPPDFVLVEKIGAGSIGFTWNGSVLTTNEPKPPVPQPAPNQPNTEGTLPA
jgi:hypothetical protein